LHGDEGKEPHDLRFCFAKTVILSTIHPQTSGITSMRSQKISNRAPRPFKNQQSTKGWSGGNGSFIPGGQRHVQVKKPTPPPPVSEETANTEQGTEKISS
jgi:hypothetical protein